MSELWQRLREMRKYANKTQLEMAKVAGVTRSGYAFWENPDPEQRTRPNSDQTMAMCQATKVPVAWLMNDTSDINDLWRGPAALKAAESAPSPYVSAPAPATSDRAQQRFWAAVEYIVTNQDPTKDSAFGVPVRAGAVELQADYLQGNTVAVFSRNGSDDAVLQTIGYLYVLAKAAKLRDPRMVLLLRSGETPSEGLVESARRFLAVQVSQVETPEAAAVALLNQA